MSKKTEVLRLTKEESSLIHALRGYGYDNIVCEIDRMIKDGGKAPIESLQELRNILRREPLCTLEEMIHSEIISKEDADFLLESYANNRNIVISGEDNHFRNSVLKSILLSSNNQENIVCVINPPVKGDFVRDIENKAILELETADLTVRELMKTVLSPEVDKIIFSDITKPDDILSVITTIAYNLPLIFTMPTTDSVKESLIKSSTGLREIASELIQESSFVVVNCYKQKGKAFVKVETKG